MAAIALALAWPKVSLTCMNTALRGAVLVAWNRSRINPRPLRTSSGLVGKLRKGNLSPCSGMRGAVAAHVSAGFGVCIHKLDIDAEHLPDHAGGEVGALLAGLADEALHAGLWQADAA